MKKLKTVVNNLKPASGFTLIELLIVFAVIGVLASILTLAVGNSQDRARDARRKSDLRSMQTAIESFKNDHGFAPKTGTNNKIAGCGTINGSGDGSDCEWGGEFSANGIVYTNKLPQDPVYNIDPAFTYKYSRGAQVDEYTLESCLEVDSDSACVITGGSNWCTTLGGCLYRVTVN